MCSGSRLNPRPEEIPLARSRERFTSGLTSAMRQGLQSAEHTTLMVMGRAAGAAGRPALPPHLRSAASMDTAIIVHAPAVSACNSVCGAVCALQVFASIECNHIDRASHDRRRLPRGHTFQRQCMLSLTIAHRSPHEHAHGLPWAALYSAVMESQGSAATVCTLQWHGRKFGPHAFYSAHT